MSEFKIGDTVRQKGSSNLAPVMTVSYYSKDDVRCTYWQHIGQVFLTASFKPEELDRHPS